MSEPNFNDLVKKIQEKGDFDHANLEEIDKIGKSEGFDQKTTRQAFFVARDISTLAEGEVIDGGTGSEIAKTDPKEVLQATFSKGKK